MGNAPPQLDGRVGRVDVLMLAALRRRCEQSIGKKIAGQWTPG
jgi:hypothetical protein